MTCQLSKKQLFKMMINLIKYEDEIIDSRECMICQKSNLSLLDIKCHSGCKYHVCDSCYDRNEEK